MYSLDIHLTCLFIAVCGLFAGRLLHRWCRDRGQPPELGGSVQAQSERWDGEKELFSYPLSVYEQLR